MPLPIHLGAYSMVIVQKIDSLLLCNTMCVLGEHCHSGGRGGAVSLPLTRLHSVQKSIMYCNSIEYTTGAEQDFHSTTRVSINQFACLISRYRSYQWVTSIPECNVTNHRCVCMDAFNLHWLMTSEIGSNYGWISDYHLTGDGLQFRPGCMKLFG